MFRTRLRVPRQSAALALGLRASPNARRSIHHVPTLAHDFSRGVPNLMSPGGFMVAWTHYMQLMVEKLNALTAGTCELGTGYYCIALAALLSCRLRTMYEM